jgi:oxygen-independent coproporphyrinogen III oxidase
MTLRPFALYIHVPFCAQKCPYCDFNTYAVARVPDEEYTTALIEELEYWGRNPRFCGRSLSTIFFGGGTPSLLSRSSLSRIIDAAKRVFGLNHAAEITLEANPSTPTRSMYEGFVQAGITRISFGVQSFDAERLRLLGRDHSPLDAENAVRYSVDAGLTNVSVDLIFGVSGQTLNDVERDIDAACALPITHLSTYALTIEPGTPFFQRQERGLLVMPHDEAVAEMLLMIPQRLSTFGFERYEISNYSKPGMHSRHNEAYWVGTDYLGIGAGAHSYVASYQGEQLVGAERWSTLAQPAAYMKGANEDKVISWREPLTVDALMFEFFYLGLRRMVGVSLNEFSRRFGGDCLSRYEQVLNDLSIEGFVVHDNGRVTLTPQGIALADSVYERFL